MDFWFPVVNFMKFEANLDLMRRHRHDLDIIIMQKKFSCYKVPNLDENFVVKSFHAIPILEFARLRVDQSLLVDSPYF